MAAYTRNIQGARVELTLTEVDPDDVILDSELFDPQRDAPVGCRAGP